MSMLVLRRSELPPAMMREDGDSRWGHQDFEVSPPSRMQESHRLIWSLEVSAVHKDSDEF